MRSKLMMIFIICPAILCAQVVSQFSFDANPPSNADVGPNASSISSSATSDVGGVGGTNGLNAGLPKLNIDMVIPGSPTFDLPGIGVSFDYHREENGGTFFQRGNSLRINGCANLSVNYRVDDGGGGFNTVNSGNVFSIPNDDTFRNYRFTYTPCDGVGQLLVDGVVVWSNDGPDFRDMYWTGSGDVTVGGGIDGTGNNDTFFDNLVVGLIDCSPLPVGFVSFEGWVVEDRRHQLLWKTASETNNSHFTLYKSKNGVDWEFWTSIDGIENSTVETTYELVDLDPYEDLTYYKLSQTDNDGTETFLSEIFIKSKAEELEIFPNPVLTGQMIKLSLKLTQSNEYVDVLDVTGRLLERKTLSAAPGVHEFTELKCDFAPGTYILKAGDKKVRLVVE